MPPRRHIDKVSANADRMLGAAHETAKSQAELIQEYRRFLKTEEHRIRLEHKRCAQQRFGGVEVSAKRSQTLDIVLHQLFHRALTEGSREARVALVATGGYGRGLLNPGSDIDLHFFHPGSVTPGLKEIIEKVLYMLWDVGFKVGHAVRSLKETFAEANRSAHTKSSLIEARFVTGERLLFDEFQARFRKACIAGQETAYLEGRRQDLLKRHADHFGTFLVKEPNIKNGCGGLRDYQNILWTSWVKTGTLDLDELVRLRLFGETAAQELRKALDFLLLVRNDLHYAEKSGTDVLTLRAQGVTAKNLHYPGRRITQKSDAFMKDYYLHTRNIFQHNQSLMERFEMALERKPKPRLLGILGMRRGAPPREQFDGFYSEGGFLFPAQDTIFSEDSSRMMRLFQHCQQRCLRPSLQLRELLKEHWKHVNKTFQYKKANRETFEAILSRKGDVSRTLRLMHQTGFLGRYLPEFGSLTDLVQHEFFHRFTADEHTLQTIEKLDELSDTQNAKVAFQQQLFHDLEDPYILYLALIMHDTGRAEDVRQHAFASEELTDRVCLRLQISQKRRRRLMFLVGHHLTLWHTATTKDPDDPTVVEQFARTVGSKEWLDALFLMTYADASATYEHGWTGWKETLLRQLYHNTVEFLSDQEAFQLRSQSASAELRRAAESALDKGYADDIAAHFCDMPERYFRTRDADRVIDHIRLLRKFFRQLVRDDPQAALAPVIKWTPRPEQGCSEVTLVSWDRRLLLARTAGAMAACGINILSADLFLRRDNVVLDIFRVCTASLQPVTNETVIEQFNSLLRQALTAGDVDFSALAAAQSASSEPNVQPEWWRDFPSRVYLSNDLHAHFTVVEIQAVDRIGLLYAVFQAIGGLGLEITHARINTEKGAAIDTFYVVDDTGKKISPPAQAALQQALREIIGVRGETDHVSG
ncbi:MAG: [protein-PII] uridylyltransferase [Verrucomicrobiales bacterium]|nr:[protein-PII] uridylyltransferase [Verrucomicrobiales bacterium]